MINELENEIYEYENKVSILEYEIKNYKEQLSEN